MDMLFQCMDNQSVGIELLEYQFSQRNNGLGDSHEPEKWIIISVSVKSNVGNWNAKDPSLEIDDIPIISDWFKTLSQNRPVKYEGNLSFTEPCLEFQLLNSFDSPIKRIKIKIGGELYPKWDWEKYNYAEIIFEADNQQLIRLAHELFQNYTDFLKRNNR